MPKFVVHDLTGQPSAVLEAADSTDAELYAAHQLPLAGRPHRLDQDLDVRGLPVHRVPRQEARRASSSTVRIRARDITRKERSMELTEAGRSVARTGREALDRISGAPRPTRSGGPSAENELERSFQRLGLSEAGARVAAAGRDSMASLDLTPNMQPAGAGVAAGDGWSDHGFKAADFAYAPDPKDDSTWRGLMLARPGEKPDWGAVLSAAKLFFNHFGEPYYLGASLPAADIDAIRARLQKAWKDATADQIMPPELGGPPSTESARSGDHGPVDAAMERLGRAWGNEGRMLETFVRGRS
jgi:hypothetical protein